MPLFRGIEAKRSLNGKGLVDQSCGSKLIATERASVIATLTTNPSKLGIEAVFPTLESYKNLHRGSLSRIAALLSTIGPSLWLLPTTTTRVALASVAERYDFLFP
jgi:hypothetical protein